MGLLKKRSVLPIGIHIAGDMTHMVQLEQTNGAFHLVAQVSQPHPKAAVEGPAQQPEDPAQWNEAAREFIKHAVRTSGFRGTNAVCCLPSNQLAIQHVRLPSLAPEDVAKSLSWELQGKLTFNPKDAIIRHLIAGTVLENNETKTDVIALAVRRAIVEKHTRMMTRAGVRVCGLGVEACAMSVPFSIIEEREAAQAPVPRAVMIFNLGATESHAAIIRGDSLVFVKDIAMGGRDLSPALQPPQGDSKEPPEPTADTGDTNIVGALVEEIESCIRYHASISRGARVDKVLLVGSSALDAEVSGALSQHLGLPVEAGDPLAITKGPGFGKDVKEDQLAGQIRPELAVAVGLSLYGMQ